MNIIGEMSSVKMEGSNDSANSNNGDSKASNNCNLIVNYLPQSLKEHDFNALFSKIGQLKTCKLMFDRQTGKAKSNPASSHGTHTANPVGI